jgi:enoyl-CoA hydratase/carnithine racemase
MNILGRCFMPLVELENYDAVAVLRLANGVTNAIGPAVVDDLEVAFKEIKDCYKGMVLTGGKKFFSIGLSLPELLTMNRNEMGVFWSRFEEVVLELYSLPMPTVCAIAGHAPAAGTILALACDFRFIATGRNLLGLNEIKLGLPVPYLADRMLRKIVCDRAAKIAEYEGELMMPEEAKNIGLVDEILPTEEVEKKAIEKIAEIPSQNFFGIKVMKQCRGAELRTQFLSERASINEAFMDCWFHPSVQSLLREASKTFWQQKMQEGKNMISKDR